MTLRRNGLYGLGLVSGVLTAACDAAGPDGAKASHSQVQIDLRRLVQAELQGEPISVIDTVTLTIAPTNGAEQSFQHATLTDAPVTFDVTLETGTASFATTVLSNNGTTLYEGEATANIQEDASPLRSNRIPCDP